MNSCFKALFLVILVMVIYFPSLKCDYIWDDDSLALKVQRDLSTIQGLKEIWFELGATKQYYPMTFTSFWVENFFWGSDPFGYHLTNVLLHSFVSVFIFFIFKKLSVQAAFLISLIFALHPVHVESVTWIAERKNVLSAFFYMLSLLFYLKFIFIENHRCRERKYYFFSLFLFICALLSKTVTCSLPVVFLLILWWKKRKVSFGDFKLTVPFFVVGFFMGLVTIIVERETAIAVGAAWDISLIERFLIAARALCFYVGKLIWPSQLTFIYPRWEMGSLEFSYFIYPVMVLGVFLLFWIKRSHWGRGPLVALIFFVVTLFPALGFFNIFPMRYSFVADHFQYLASISMIVLVINFLYLKLKNHTWLNIQLIKYLFLIPFIFSFLTYNQQKQYQHSETLWKETVKKNPQCFMAYTHLAALSAQRGDVKAAIAYNRHALSLNPLFVEAHNGLGNYYMVSGKYQQAMEHLIKAKAISEQEHIKYGNINETYGVTCFYLARLHKEMNQKDEAIRVYRYVIELMPDHSASHYDLASLYLEQNNDEQAMKHFEKVVELNSHEALITLAKDQIKEIKLLGGSENSDKFK